MNIIKNIFFIITSMLILVSTSANANKVENVAALNSAERLCGYKLNKEMYALSINVLFADPSELQSGGEYSSELNDNYQRIKKLTSTEEGRESFCRRIKYDLSAFFD